MKKLNLTSVVIYSLVIILNFSSNTYAETSDESSVKESIETKKENYSTPRILQEAKLESVNSVMPILSSETYNSWIQQYAQNLNDSALDKLDMFNRVALLSLRRDVTAILNLVSANDDTLEYLHYQLFHEVNKAMEQPLLATQSFRDVATKVIAEKFRDLSDKAFARYVLALGWSVDRARDYIYNVFKQVKNESELTDVQMVELAVNTHLYHVLEAIIPVSSQVIEREQSRRFIVQPEVLVTLPNGAEISTTIVRSREQSTKLNTALQFTIYADESAHIKSAIQAASYGYVGIVANSRGKRGSRNEIVPWEHDGEDAALLIDWITEQAWSNGTVVMYGGSYNGFTQWAAAKHMPKGLKAMAPYVAANLITGLPYENNIALTGNFEWGLYVTNNKTVDDTIYANWQRANNILDELYKSGRPIVDIDKVAEKPNPWLQKWLAEPEDSAYYQRMVPHQEDYKRINIPVLSITGYFEGGQISALHYLHEHYKFNRHANHALLIGPYNHWSAQNKPRSHHSNYELDPVALKKDTNEVVFAWFDHVLNGEPKPELVQNKVNYQLMGANEWRFADSLEALNHQYQRFYIQARGAADSLPNSENEAGKTYLLSKIQTAKATDYIEQVVDMADRQEQRNRAPWPVIQNTLDKQGGIQIETPVFEQDMELTGAISGFFDIEVNKRDVDIGFNYYEITADGQVFHLNNYRSRASYADDMATRRLLTPNEKRRVPIVNARFTSKLIKKGSKIVLVLNVNKNVDAQVNLGTGKPVNFEHVSEAGDKLSLKWYLSSEINLPLKPYRSNN